MAAKPQLIRHVRICKLSDACLVSIKAAISEKRQSLIHHDLLINIDYTAKNVTVKSNDEDIDFTLSAYDRRIIFEMFK